MKFFTSTLLLIFIAGCAGQRYDWVIEQYMKADVVNQSDQDVQAVFCSKEPAAVSKSLFVPADRKNYTSKTLYKSFTDKTSDHPQLNPPSRYEEYFSYAALSDSDLISNKLCVNANAFEANDPYKASYQNRKTEKYLILNKTDVCPADFKDFDQTKNPC